jgi:hypothetical protein
MATLECGRAAYILRNCDLEAPGLLRSVLLNLLLLPLTRPRQALVCFRMTFLILYHSNSVVSLA